MTEDEARAALRDDFNVPRETFAKLETFIAFLAAENEVQNLVSRGTLGEIWNRHILDSVQLLRFRTSANASWLDLGSGAGFPGLVIGLLHDGPVTLVEERRKRADFLDRAAILLGLGVRVRIEHRKVERLDPQTFDIITARAFAPLDRLLDLSHDFSTAKTRFILPKGRNARSELDDALASWQGEFRLEQSLTDADAQIVVADGVSRKAKGRKAGGSGTR
jgi:16S rRNA (guanine527-N7)-methyltransferase